ncbi:MAG: hypothetical protein H7320_02285 [Ferruginibacter sp.]|nr:hypothetical protein [Ferruginibacter sp.]
MTSKKIKIVITILKALSTAVIAQTPSLVLPVEHTEEVSSASFSSDEKKVLTIFEYKQS